VTTRWFAAKTPSCAFQGSAVSAAVESLFAGQTYESEPATTLVIRTRFARRTDAVRKRMAFTGEPMRVMWEHLANDGTPARIEVPTGIGKTALYCWLAARLDAGLADVTITETAIPRNTPCVPGEAVYRTLQKRYPVLRSPGPQQSSVEDSSRHDPGGPTRAALRNFARLLTKGMLATEPGHMGIRFLAGYERLIRLATVFLRSPDPALRPGQLVTSRRRPTRGPTDFRTGMSFVPGVAIA
jgi:hypothetical protein